MLMVFLCRNNGHGQLKKTLKLSTNVSQKNIELGTLLQKMQLSQLVCYQKAMLMFHGHATRNCFPSYIIALQ
jgi:hypothetical protein